MLLQTGDLVHVRSRQYLVEHVEPPPRGGESHLVSLSCLDDDARGEKIQVLWDKEIDARRLEEASWEAVASRGFDEPRLFSSYLHTLRWNSVTSTDAKLFQAPYRAGIEVKAYQLEPLRMALGMPRVNLFIADDVGLGKTIEAGLILRELLMRQKVQRCVIAAPPSVVYQWRDEMEQRFGLTFVIYDREYVARQRRERGYGINPWKTHSRFLISHALIRDEAYAAGLRDWLTTFSSGALLILDEAHNAAPASGARYAIDSKLTRVIRDLAPRFEHRLFLSATPHNGHSNSFSALLEILDPQKFIRGDKVEPKLRDSVLVRRLKSDLREIGEQFPIRRVLRIDPGRLPEDAPELVLSQLLQDYRQLREEQLKGVSRTKRASALLVVTSLQKRLLSSIEAFARTLQVHRNTLARKAAEAEPEPAVELDAATALPLLFAAPGADDDRADLPDEENQAEEDAQVALGTRQATLAGQELTQARAILDRMMEVANRARYDPDPRVRFLIRWMRENLCPDLGAPGAQWKERRVLIFTEYTDTKRYLEEQLRSAIKGSDRDSERIATFQGGPGDAKREATKAAFNLDPARHPLRILIATEAAREGINLQNHCADLFHFDIPWNPSRMEQRNGRIDRKLQRAPEVRCHYFVLPQRTEDRVLDVLVEKSRRISEELGSLLTVVDKRVDHLLQDGIRHSDEARLKEGLENIEQGGPDEPNVREVVEEELEGTRKRQDQLKGKVAELDRLLKVSKDWIGLNDVHFRDAISASLEILGAPALAPVDPEEAVRNPEKVRWEIPRLQDRMGADPSWAVTLDALRTPRKKNQKPWDWRKESPVRPVVFSDPGSLDGEVVHLHLEHRVVQRLLGRFVAQGFQHHELSRACIVRTTDPIPRVVLFGRLSLFGEGASRLHDEVIAAVAEWEDPSQRGRGRLKALGEGAKEEVLRILDDALAHPRMRDVPQALRDRLMDCAVRDVEELRNHLERRAGDLADRAERKLDERGEKEAKEMLAILEGQRERIRKLQGDKSPMKQLSLHFSPEERRQAESEMRAWADRLVALEKELVEEPERVKGTYDVRARRVEPVGLVYLWPVSN